MNIVRTILAILITISLTLAPGVSAVAAVHENGAPTTTSASADTSTAMTDVDMSDCMKAMHAKSVGGSDTSTSKSGCKCCDTKHQCPDSANCMTKCCKVIGALKPAGKIVALTMVAYHQAEPAKPPNWVSSPPFTPPRS